MSEPRIVFDDGAGYERFMGVWSRKVATPFLQWLSPAPGSRWLDVGCGNGAFTQEIVDHCEPKSVIGIDPSAAQIDFARSRPAARQARFEVGDAMALPVADADVDIACMALVIFFVPDPPLGVAEMARVVRPGGLVAAYAWDILEKEGFPLHPLQTELRAMGLQPPMPPSAEASRREVLQGLWTAAGLQEVQTTQITVERTFEDFDEFWSTNLLSAGLKSLVTQLPEATLDQLRGRVRNSLPADANGRITFTARANAIRGRVPV